MAGGEQVRGTLLIQVEEASGKTQRDQFSWDTSVQERPFEAFVKGEKRGRSRGGAGVVALSTGPDGCPAESVEGGAPPLPPLPEPTLPKYTNPCAIPPPPLPLCSSATVEVRGGPRNVKVRVAVLTRGGAGTPKHPSEVEKPARLRKLTPSVQRFVCMALPLGPQVNSRKAPLVGETITWREELKL